MNYTTYQRFFPWVCLSLGLVLLSCSEQPDVMVDPGDGAAGMDSRVGPGMDASEDASNDAAGNSPMDAMQVGDADTPDAPPPPECTSTEECDDENPCTDERCVEGMCMRSNNMADCDDGLFCNGTDTCADGMCSVHSGEPCPGETTCNEEEDTCEGCVMDSECPAEILGPWSSCGGFDGMCGETGMRSRTRTTFSCEMASCVGSERTETEACTRTTTGDVCGSPMSGAWGDCGSFSGTCGEMGTRTRTVTHRICSGGSCGDDPRMVSEACVRDTDGASCGDSVPGAWSACTGFAGACGEMGTRSRTVVDRVCTAGGCADVMRTETEACTRDTDGTSCGMPRVGDWGGCSGFSGTCGESGSRVRTVTDRVCSAGACSDAARTESEACARDTDGTMCGSTITGSWSGCGSFGSTCGESGTRTRSITDRTCRMGSCADVSRTESESCTRETDGNSCGSSSAGGWSACDGFSGTCDESGNRSRTVTDRVCSSGACTDSRRTESESCGRDTDGTSCGSTSAGGWSSCGFSDTCDETGTQSRTLTDRICSSGSCSDSMRSESRSCGRDTDGTTCGTSSTGAWSGCGFSSTCDESGTRTRTITDRVCSSGSCGSSSRTETGACSRDTDGSSCGSSSTGAWSSCGYSDTCDESASQSRTITDRVCRTGSCSDSSRSETRSCSRDTDGTTCGSSSTGAWSGCGFSSTCDESGTRTRTVTDRLCSSGSCGSSSRTETGACGRDTDGTSCGSSSTGAWSSCGYSDTCDESASQSRTITDRLCSSGSCSDSSRSESRACSRDTDGTSCGTTSTGAWSDCGFSSTCDETGSQSRTITARLCGGGSCGDSPTTESRSCSRDTDGTTCGSRMEGPWSACAYSSTCDERGEQSRTITTNVCSAASCNIMTTTETRSCTRDTDGDSCRDEGFPGGFFPCLVYTCGGGRCLSASTCPPGSTCCEFGCMSACF